MLKRSFVTGSIVALVVAATAVAAPPRPTSSLSLVVLASTSSGALAAATSSTPVAHWGDAITFDVSTTATDMPYVTLNCYVDGVWVLTGTRGFYPDFAWGQVFGLSNTAWTGGPGDCTAELYYEVSSGKNVKTVSLAKTSFHVDA